MKPLIQEPTPEPLTTAQVMEIADEIDTLNDKVCRLIDRIRKSTHPEASAITEELDEQCRILACAKDIVSSINNPEGN